MVRETLIFGLSRQSDRPGLRRGFAAVVAALATALCAPPLATAEPLIGAIGPYAPRVEYPAGSLVVGPDGNTYRATDLVKGVDPTQATADSWQLSHVAKEVILDVPGRFKSIEAAMTFLAGSRIAEGTKAVVLVAPGTVELTEPLFLDHSEGQRIILRGGGDGPEDCRLVFEDADPDQTDGIVVTAGNVACIEGLSIESATNRGRGIGLLVDEGSRVRLRNCRLIDFSCVLGGGASMTASDCSFVLDRDGDGVHVRNGSTAILSECSAVTKNRRVGCFGFHAYNGGTLFCTKCTATGWDGGFKAYTNSEMHLEQCVATSNKYGASAWYSSSMNVTESDFMKNDDAAIGAICGTASLVGCRLSGNEIGVVSVGTGYAAFIGAVTTIKDSKIGIRALGGGRADLATAPQFESVRKELEVFGRACDLTLEEAFMRP